MKENNGQLVKLSMAYEDEKVTLNNIIGRIPGKDGSKAILITAHLDHVGGIGDSIFRGALDNSSGVSILLEVARQLGEYSKENSFSRDIIFCATNSEEANCTGSQKLSEKLSLDYKDFMDINLDCIGEKNINQLIICSNENLESKEFAKEVANFFNDKDIKTVVSSELVVTDHISFPKSILITTGFDGGYLHKVIDTIDKLDIGFMEKVTDILKDFIIQCSLNVHIETVKNDKKSDRIIEIIDRESEKLKFGEYKFIKIDDKIKYIINCNFSGSLDEVNKIFNNAFSFIPEELECGELEEIQVDAFRSQYYKTPVVDDHELDKVYMKENLLDDINNVWIIYKDTKTQNHTYITAHKFVKENSIEMKFYNQYIEDVDETTNVIDTENYTYYIVNIEEGKFDTLIVSMEDESEIYLVKIYGDYVDHNDKDGIINFIKENNIESIISNFIECLSK